MSSDASIAASAATLREHFAHTILPIWRGPGFNSQLQLPFEAVSAETHQPLPVTRYRAMACARQLFVFSQAGDADHAHQLFESLRRCFADTRHGGWFYSVDANGAPLDTTKDLYTHAFIVFACAGYFAAFGNRNALATLNETTALIEARFAVAQKNGLLAAALDADFATVREGPLQNPLMHLTEAYLAAREATGDAAFGDALARLALAVAGAFVHAPTGCIAELPIGAADNRLEPGHQFEWFYLVKRAGAAIAASGLEDALERAFDFAQELGVDRETGGVHAALDEQGGIKDATQRIWAQTEYLRALATRGDAASLQALPQQIERFRTRFLHARGWYECKTPEGAVARADMPSTTPYHLATAYAALPVRS
ncbi:N-acylglucosamine 2-epimerase [Trinickia terrae]|uniref:N-acylglucosamine 2-epimerase n=1 Tax=Trinickia terrae TaxID=2571161 RepID=A0A4U1HJ34_9BURK|nr:AGE family epimerase/isomerase [Trinickia terrae]TKC79918.1 N-acylglucosamine 2-epimerase [Trinickia terrae]